MSMNYLRMKGRQGSAMVTVLSILMAVWLCIESIQFTSMSRTVSSKRVNAQVRAQLMAEAGANWAYSVLASNFSRRSNAETFAAAEYGVGSWTGRYTLAVTPVSNNMATICATGYVYMNSMNELGEPTVYSAKSRVLLDIKNYGPDWGGGDTQVWNFAGFAGSGGGSSGAATLAVSNGGTIHIEGTFDLSGGGDFDGSLEATETVSGNGDGEILGDATAPNFEGSMPENIVGNVITAQVESLDMPILDFTPYYNEALANGDVFTGNQTWSSLPGTVAVGDIVWINGDIRITGNFDMLGISIFATGDINIAGQGSYSNAEQYPLFASRDGDVDIAGNGDYSGLIYVLTGDFSKTGDGLLTGQVICAGQFTSGGGWDGFAYETEIPVAPGSGGNDDVIGVSAWQE